MKNKLIAIVVFALTLASCASQPSPTEQSLLPDLDVSPTKALPNLTSAQLSAITLLSETLSLPADQITLVSSESVTWSDGCLGVQRMGVMCTQALVDGYKIILEANGEQYELHTNESGTAVVIANDLNDTGSIELILTKQLSVNRSLSLDSISVISNEPVEFGDSCLGVSIDGVMCAQVITSGRIVLLEANGIQYEYHTSEDGSRIQPATFALTWKREGGLAGFCDSMTIFLSGEVYGNQCKSQDGRMGALASLLSFAEMEQFDAWVADNGQVTLDASDPQNVTDGMTHVIVLFGTGKGKPGKPVEDEIFVWAQDLFQRLYQ